MTDKSSETLRKCKNSLNVTDMWKYMNPDTNDFTYIDPSFRHMNSRIDILCVCEQIKPCVESCDHVITLCPDHKAVVLCVRGDERPRGRGYWKLNVSVLGEENYKESICKIISDTLSEYRHQVEKVIWELVKIRVKEYSLRYCCLRTKSKKKKK